MPIFSKYVTICRVFWTIFVHSVLSDPDVAVSLNYVIDPDTWERGT